MLKGAFQIAVLVSRNDISGCAKTFRDTFRDNLKYAPAKARGGIHIYSQTQSIAAAKAAIGPANIKNTPPRRNSFC